MLLIRSINALSINGVAHLLQLSESGQGHERERGGGGGDGRAPRVEAIDAQGIARRDDKGSDQGLVQHLVHASERDVASRELGVS